MTAPGTPRGNDTTARHGPLALPVRQPELRWRRAFPGHEAQLRNVRRWLAELLPGCPARDDVLAVTVEFATNAVQHTASGRGGWFAVEVTWYATLVRVAVADAGAPGAPQIVGDPLAERGRGLVIVRELAARTGVCGDDTGRLVWADIPWDEVAAVAPASSQDGHQAAIRDILAVLACRLADGSASSGWGKAPLGIARSERW
jgi:hypothetical protein